MNTLWTIQHTTRSGSTWLHYTGVRSTRKEAWRAFEAHYHSSTDKWRKEIARRRRKGLVRAVKVVLHKMDERCPALLFPKGK